MASATPINNKDLILETIDQLRKRKARPDLERISHMLERRYAVSCAQTEADLAKLVADAVVIKVDYKGSTSYRNAAKWGRRNCACPGPSQQALPGSPAEPANNAIAAAEIATDAPCNGRGAYVEDVDKYLSIKGRQLTKSSLHMSLNKESDAGRQKKLITGSYVCIQPPIVVLAVEPAAAANETNIEQKITMKRHVEDVESDATADGEIANEKAPVATDSNVDSTREQVIKAYKVEVQSQGVFQPPLEAASRGHGNAAGRKGHRPTNKRKRFKKTHGPDFVEDYDSSFEESADPKCDYCLLTAECNRDGEREELLFCKDCSTKAHPSCMDYSKDLAAKSHMSPWQCMDCKTCCVCTDLADGSTVLFCDSCDKGYHMGCHEPKVTSKPTGKWMCLSCCSEAESAAEDAGRVDSEVNDERDSSEPADNGHDSLEDCGESEVMDTTEKDSTNQTVDGALGLPTPCDSPVPEDEQNRKSFNTIFIPGNADPNIVRLNSGNDNKSEVPNATEWTIDEVVGYFKSAGFPEQATAFRDQEIDGRSLLLMKRNDVLTGLSLKLGPALKIYNHVKRLQMSLDENLVG